MALIINQASFSKISFFKQVSYQGICKVGTNLMAKRVSDELVIFRVPSFGHSFHFGLTSL